MVVAAAAIIAAAPAAAQDRQVEIGQIVLDLCPKILDGTISLTDPTQIGATGFTLTAPRQTPEGKNPRAEKGAGTTKVVISASADMCSVWFGGPDNPLLAGKLIEQARAAKFKGGGPLTLGDGTMLFSFKQNGKPARSLVILLADAGGELGFKPASTVVMMNEKR
jgi:hypothetical protein